MQKNRRYASFTLPPRVTVWRLERASRPDRCTADGALQIQHRQFRPPPIKVATAAEKLHLTDTDAENGQNLRENGARFIGLLFSCVRRMCRIKKQQFANYGGNTAWGGNLFRRFCNMFSGVPQAVGLLPIWCSLTLGVWSNYGQSVTNGWIKKG